MSAYVKRLKHLLGAACDAVSLGVPSFDEATASFTVPRSGVEVVREPGVTGGFMWRVREVYEVPDLQRGGHQPIEDVIVELAMGDEVEAVRQAVLRAVARQIEVALDSAA